MTQEDTDNLSKFVENIGIHFNNLDLLKEALTHRSYVNESDNSKISHNERLEYLGDAVLELLTTQFLFEKYPDRPEGDLTSFRAALVRTESLADTAKELHYGEHIFMSKGEEATGGRDRTHILANTYESILGAMYLDLGLDVCDEFVKKTLLPKVDEIVANRLDVDPKSKLQEIAQEMLKETPVYQLEEEQGPDHNKIFVMAVVINGVQFGTGKGRSKQIAEQEAARYTLRNWDSLYKKYQNSVKIDPDGKTKTN